LPLRRAAQSESTPATFGLPTVGVTNMFRICIALIVLLVATTGGRADACSIILGPLGLPSTGLVRLSGVVTGYGVGAGSVRNVRQPPGLRVRVEEVVSGGLRGADAEVYPLSLGPDCSSGAIAPIELERRFPVGTRVVVQGELLAWPEAAQGAVVAVDVMKNGFARAVPDNAEWTAEGDLDFERSGLLPNVQFTRFEFDRVVLTLANSPASQRGARLRNLALYPEFRNLLDARTFYRELLSESGIPYSQQLELLGLFDDRKSMKAR
jgi:hypothetical protein